MDQATMSRRMEDCGLRPTKQRLAVYAYLLSHPVHPTAETIYRELTMTGQDFSRATVYNSLNKLVDAGLIKALSIEAEEQRFDADMAEHGHFRCTTCGNVMDFPLDLTETEIPYPAGCAIRWRELFCYGLCGECQEKG